MSFAYVPIPEQQTNRENLATLYDMVTPATAALGISLPAHLEGRAMHLDPDFRYLTYGDRGRKGRQITNLRPDDVLVFYSGLRDTHSRSLVYAIIGLFVVETIQRAPDVPHERRHENAHTRREIALDADDVVVFGKRSISGRLRRCIPIGSYRARAYRVTPQLLDEWGGITANDGYLQRSAVLPGFTAIDSFWRWWLQQDAELIANNND